MGAKTTVVVVCDLCDEEEATTYTLAFEGVAGEIDLCAEDAENLKDSLKAFLDNMRVTSQPPRKRASPAVPQVKVPCKVKGCGRDIAEKFMNRHVTSAHPEAVKKG